MRSPVETGLVWRTRIAAKIATIVCEISGKYRESASNDFPILSLNNLYLYLNLRAYCVLYSNIIIIYYFNIQFKSMTTKVYKKKGDFFFKHSFSRISVDFSLSWNGTGRDGDKKCGDRAGNDSSVQCVDCVGGESTEH